MTNPDLVAQIFPEIKDPVAAAEKIQIALGPDRTFELGWERALVACRLWHEERKPDINWRQSGMAATYNWALGAVKYGQTKPIELDRPSIIITEDLGDGF